MSKTVFSLALVGTVSLILAAACGDARNTPFEPSEEATSNPTSPPLGQGGTSGSLGSSGSPADKDSGTGACAAETADAGDYTLVAMNPGGATTSRQPLTPLLATPSMM